jgi:ERCC4-type nuclease
MNRSELNKIIESFSIIVDTREQMTQRSEQRYAAMGEVSRATLDYGDYTYNLMLPDGPLHDTSVRIKPKCVVERKQNLDELANRSFRMLLENIESAGTAQYEILPVALKDRESARKIR